ncbi:MAG: hypothetical protein Fur0041_00100 [Bacteroidia bacterium]
MILMHISSPDIDLLKVIAEKLLKENYVADVRIDNISRLTLKEGKLQEVPRYLLACKTKALLFTPIVDFLKQTLRQPLPEIYALPLVNIEYQHEQEIRSRTKAV